MFFSEYNLDLNVNFVDNIGYVMDLPSDVALRNDSLLASAL